MNNVLCIGGPLDKQVLSLPASRYNLVCPFTDYDSTWLEGRPLEKPNLPEIRYEIRRIAFPMLGTHAVLRAAIAPWLVDDMDEIEARVRRNKKVWVSLMRQAQNKVILEEKERALYEKKAALRDLEAEVEDLRFEIRRMEGRT